MLIRIVRMSFQEDKVAEFLKVFNANKQKIRAFEGCTHLQLWQDYHQANIFSTYSIWQEEANLENYRHSALFQEVWSQTKVLFADKPVAFSSKQNMLVDLE